MNLHGKSLILGTQKEKGGEPYSGKNPRDGSRLEPTFFSALVEDVDAAMEAAEMAFMEFSCLSAERRAELLEEVARELEENCDGLIERAHEETALPVNRLLSERSRTCNQLRLFAAEIREGTWVNARIDGALPDRNPVPRPDLRRMLIPIGPVVVFGASNFPLAFSVAGGDVASALAVGCPVIVKAHEAHPGTSEIVAMAIIRAIARCNLPQGIFALLHGEGKTIGSALVKHPLAAAVAFTGSHGAGRAIFDAAASRAVPIPVFAEMASINPLFILTGALKTRSAEIARELVNSVTLGAGQFCTKPGIIFVVQSEGVEDFISSMAGEMKKVPSSFALHHGIASAYYAGIDKLLSIDGVYKVMEGPRQEDPRAAGLSAILLRTNGSVFEHDQGLLQQEIFGPVCLVVLVESMEEMHRLARCLEGQLTATIHRSEEDGCAARELTGILIRKAGRLIQNSYPTGVEVSPAMTHGGPYPASTDSRHTSVGTASMFRFVRPVTFQNYPPDELPAELCDSNPRGIQRLVNGSYTREGL